MKKIQFQKISTILIWSEHWQQLAEWYQQKLSLTVIEEINHPQDTGRLLEFPEGGTRLWVGQHSQIKGQSKDPCRIMFNINVESVSLAYTYLSKLGVTFIAAPFKAPTFDKWFATFSDLDGNLVQIIGLK